ncbi:MAG: hypothetical protein QXS62_04150, partial [Sulfolobales archaeon]
MSLRVFKVLRCVTSLGRADSEMSNTVRNVFSFCNSKLSGGRSRLVATGNWGNTALHTARRLRKERGETRGNGTETTRPPPDV